MSLKKEKDLENVNFENQMLLILELKFFDVKDALQIKACCKAVLS